MTRPRRPRRLALLATVALLSLPGVLTAARGASAADPTPDPTVDEVHYTFTSATSVAFDWRGASNDLRFGLTTAYGQTALGQTPSPLPFSSAGPFWEAQLTGLQPNTTYHYSIGGNVDSTFRTLPTTATYRFAVQGDVGDSFHSSAMAPNQALVAAGDPAFVLMLGDLSYANPLGQDAVDQHFNDVMVWSRTSAYMPVWGNHEWDTASADDLRNYKGRFALPNPQTSPNAPALGCCGEDWSWFDAGPVRFISYPEPYSSATWTDWGNRADALMAQAQADPAIRWIVTFGHQPAYSTGYHPGSGLLAGIIDGLGDRYPKYVLNLNGHSHNYERFEPIHGVTHVSAGAGGATPSPWSTTDPRSLSRAKKVHHLRVDVDATGLHLQAVCGPPTSKDDIVCSPGAVIDVATVPGDGSGLPGSTATTLYVDKASPACTDGGIGLPERPFCTIGTAAFRAVAGQTVVVASGTYNENVVPSNNGTVTAPITYTPALGATVTINGQKNGFTFNGRSYITVKGFTITNTTADGIIANTSHHLTIEGNTIIGAGRPLAGATARAVRLNSVTSSLIARNSLHHNSDSGIYVDANSAGNEINGNESYANARGYVRLATGIDVRGSNNLVTGNRTYENEDSGLQFYTPASNNLVVDNVTYGNCDHGIDNLGATQQKIYGNTVVNNYTAGINLEGQSGASSGGVVMNNIAVDNAVAGTYTTRCADYPTWRTQGNYRVDTQATALTTLDYNGSWLTVPGYWATWGTTKYTTWGAYRQATGMDAHGIGLDPRLVAPNAGDLRLGPGSAMIDAANAGLAGWPALDVDGNERVDDPATSNRGIGPRSYDDLGALEYQPPASDPPPEAHLALSATSGTAPLVIVADASGSVDTGATPITSYRFYFGDGATVVPQTGSVATHTYTVPGTYVVSVTAIDAAGQTGSAQATVEVSAPVNHAPTAELHVTPSSGTAPLDVTADAGGSTDPDASSPIASTRVDFGDGTVVVRSGAALVNHRYLASGAYTVTATVTDTAGLADVATAAVQVDDGAPAASLALSPSTGATPLLVAADGSASVDADASPIASYRFDFGDGTVVGPQLSPFASHTFATAGTFVVTLTVTDTAGLSTSTSQTVTANSAPAAALGIDVAQGRAPVTVHADASLSTDTDAFPIATYRFDFGDGTVVGPQPSPYAEHTYTDAGTFDLTVTVTDAGGLASAAVRSVVVAEPQAPPLVALSVSPSSGAAPLAVTADASGSSAPSGASIASYLFDFGDGTVVGPQPDPVAAHTYADGGTFIVTVTVTDDDGLDGTASRVVVADEAPLPALALSSPAPLTVLADASASTDTDGTPIGSYHFDFGDGATVGPQPDPTATHVYATAGTYLCTITVADTAGLSASTQAPITVAPPASGPSARVAATPSSSIAGLVSADASASTPGSAAIASYRFDFGDGTMVGPQVSPLADHVYAGSGSVTVTVTVTDSSGLSSQASASATANGAPAAALDVSPTAGTAPVTVLASSGGSTDPPPGMIASSRFDFGDGTVVLLGGTGAVEHTYVSPGTYPVTLVVTDSGGLTASASRSVTVDAAPVNVAPQAALSVTPTTGLAPLAVQADGSASTDVAPFPIASYRFDFGDGTVVVPASGATASHTYSAAGTYTVTLTVTDTGGLASQASLTVTATNPPANLVSNPGFEVSTAGWNAVGTGSTLTRVLGGRSGVASGRLSNTGSGPTSCTLNDSPNMIPVTIAGTYTSSAWVRADTAGATAKILMREYVGSTLVASRHTTTVLATTWKQLSLAVTPVSPGASTLDLQVAVSGAPVGVCFYVDDVSIIRTAPPG